VCVLSLLLSLALSCEQASVADLANSYARVVVKYVAAGGLSGPVDSEGTGGGGWNFRKGGSRQSFNDDEDFTEQQEQVLCLSFPAFLSVFFVLVL